MCMCRHWYSGLCFVSDQQAHAEEAQVAHLRIQRVVPSQASRGRILFWICFPRIFQQTSRHSTLCGTGMSIHVSAAICECRSLAHPTPQDGSCLVMACINGTGYGQSLLPCRQSDFLSTNTFRLSFVRFPFLVRSFFQGKGPGDIDSGRKSKNSRSRVLLENCSGILAQFGGSSRKAGSGTTLQLGVRARYVAIQRYF